MTTCNSYFQAAPDAPIVMSAKVPAHIAAEFDDLASSFIKSRSELLREAIVEKLASSRRKTGTYAAELDRAMG